MTAHAREVLEDCKVAIAELRDGVASREWRIKWVAAVALLRAVGHVLRNSDAKRDQVLESIVVTAWNRLSATAPEPTIFWQFIEEERNNILKEYRISAGQGVTVRPGTCHIDLRTGTQWSEPGLPTLYHYEMNSGPFAGQDQRVVLNKAVEWWDSYLSAIEQEYAATRP
jgi:hypothetical protein